MNEYNPLDGLAERTGYAACGRLRVVFMLGSQRHIPDLYAPPFAPWSTTLVQGVLATGSGSGNGFVASWHESPLQD